MALRGVVLHEFFTLRTLVAKLLGVICTLAAGSTIFLGKVVREGRKGAGVGI